MGADLYIKPLYKRVKNRFGSKFEQAVAVRNAFQDKTLVREGEEYDKLQNEVDKYYNLMDSQGYFRDSYNSSELLVLFGLDYWTKLKKLLDSDSNLQPDQAKKLLALLKRNENKFYQAIEVMNNEDSLYFANKYSLLRGFLCEAIVLESAIDCSI